MITLNLHRTMGLTDEQFEQICQANRNLRFERTAQGILVVMAPTGGETGTYNSELTGQVWFWNRVERLGKGFDSSTGFKLPNGATRSPDVALGQFGMLAHPHARTTTKICAAVPRFRY